MRKGSEMHDKSQVDIEGEPKTELKARQTMDDEEVASERLRTNDLADMKTEVRYDGTTSRVEEGFGKRLLETSGNEGVSIIEACTIKKGEEIATDNDIESEVAMDEPTRTKAEPGERGFG